MPDAFALAARLPYALGLEAHGSSVDRNYSLAADTGALWLVSGAMASEPALAEQ